MDTRALGDLTLGRVVESNRPEFPLEELIPQATAAAIAPHRHWLEATGAIDPRMSRNGRRRYPLSRG